MIITQVDSCRLRGSHAETLVSPNLRITAAEVRAPGQARPTRQPLAPPFMSARCTRELRRVKCFPSLQSSKRTRKADGLIPL